MAMNSSYNLLMVFSRTSDWKFEKVRITHRMLLLLSNLDGKRTVAEIEQMLNLTYDDLFSDLQKLHDLRLIELLPPGHRKEENAPEIRKIKKGCYRGAVFEFAE